MLSLKVCEATPSYCSIAHDLGVEHVTEQSLRDWVIEQLANRRFETIDRLLAKISAEIQKYDLDVVLTLVQTTSVMRCKLPSRPLVLQALKRINLNVRFL